MGKKNFGESHLRTLFGQVPRLEKVYILKTNNSVISNVLQVCTGSWPM